MMASKRVLLLAATETEAAPLRAYLADSEGESPLVWELAVSGCDKVNTAMTLSAFLPPARPAPDLVLQFGIAGALPAVAGGVAARPGDLVVATQEAYSDTGSSSPGGWLSAEDLALPIAEVDGRETWGVFQLDAELARWATGVLKSSMRGAGEAVAPAVLAGACVTSSLITGTDKEAELIAARWGALAESMEGAAAAHVCALHGVPFLEVRGISNAAGDRDRGSWQVERAVQVAARAALALVEAFALEGGS